MVWRGPPLQARTCVCACVHPGWLCHLRVLTRGPPVAYSTQRTWGRRQGSFTLGTPGSPCPTQVGLPAKLASLTSLLGTLTAPVNGVTSHFPPSPSKRSNGFLQLTLVVRVGYRALTPTLLLLMLRITGRKGILEPIYSSLSFYRIEN